MWYCLLLKQRTAYDVGLGIPAEPLFRSTFLKASHSFRNRLLVIIMVANKYAFLQITRRRFLNEWEAFKKVISRRNIRRRITRSEERRVGKECRCGGWPSDWNKDL